MWNVEFGIKLSKLTSVNDIDTDLCSHCGKEFILKANMKVHERIHKGKKPYLCNLCGQAFGGENNVKYH